MLLAQFIQVLKKTTRTIKQKNSLSEDTKGHKYDWDESDLSLAPYYIQHVIDLMGGNDGKTQQRTLHELIDELYFYARKNYTKDLVHQCKINANILQSIPNNTKKILLLKMDYIQRL